MDVGTQLNSLLQFLPLVFFSILAIWKDHFILFLVTAAIALITGYEAPDIISGDYETTWLGMTVGIVLIYIYTPACIIWAIKLMMWSNQERE